MLDKHSVYYQILAFNLLLAVGCTGQRESLPDAGMTVQTLEDGVVLITHQSLPSHLLGLDTLATLDPWRDDAGYLFSTIADVEGGKDSFYFVDNRNSEVVKVSGEGIVQCVFGRWGFGPGEFQNARSVAVRGDKVWINDGRNRRFSVYRQSGEYIRDIRWPELSYVIDFKVDTRERILLDYSDMVPDAPQSIYLFAYEPAGSQLDTLVRMEGLPRRSIILELVGGGKQRVVSDPEFAPYLRWSLVKGREIAIVTSLDYRIEYLNLDGDLHRMLRAPTPDLEVGGREKNWWVSEGFEKSAWGQMLVSRGMIPTRKSLEEWPFAPRRQAISGLTVDPLGRTWILANTEDLGITRLDLFDADGNYLGHFGSCAMPVAFYGEGRVLFESKNAAGLPIYHLAAIR